VQLVVQQCLAGDALPHDSSIAWKCYISTRQKENTGRKFKREIWLPVKDLQIQLPPDRWLIWELLWCGIKLLYLVPPLQPWEARRVSAVQKINPYKTLWWGFSYHPCPVSRVRLLLGWLAAEWSKRKVRTDSELHVR